MTPGSDFGSWGVESLETHINRRFGELTTASTTAVVFGCAAPVHGGLFSDASRVCPFRPQPYCISLTRTVVVVLIDPPNYSSPTAVVILRKT